VPNWNEVLKEINDGFGTNPLDSTRRKYLKELYKKTGRNTIGYYSAFIERPSVEGLEINDSDINAFMAVIHGMDRSKGLDLILHTPGGSITATESLVTYLHKLFKGDIRAIIPQIAMSAGTMIACSCKSIMMGKQSSIGPIDPQLKGIPAQGIIEEFERAITEVKKDPSTTEIWRTVVAKYPPTFIGECSNAIRLSETLVKTWLLNNMFRSDHKCEKTVEEIVKFLSDHTVSMTHSRHIDAVEAKKIGLIIEEMEKDNILQDKILTVHHAFIHTLGAAKIKKIVENHEGVALVQHSA